MLAASLLEGLRARCKSMERQGKKPLWSTLAGIIWMASGCGGLEPAQPQTSCDPGAAAIGITDGQIAILCGCAEAGGQWLANSSNLKCTVPAETVIVFHYINPVNRHQIVSARGSALEFLPSAVYQRETSPPVLAHAVRLKTPGIYDFTDQFDSSLNAQIIVLP